MVGTWWEHGTSVAKPHHLPEREQAHGRGTGAAGCQALSFAHQLPSTTTGFGQCSMNLLKAFGEKLAVAGAEPDPPKLEGMELVAQLGELEMSWW